MAASTDGGTSNLEYHVLLAIADAPLYGYAIKEAVERESAATLTPRAGSLYRVLGRLMSQGLIEETAPQDEGTPHPGRERRYYALTAAGRSLLAAETRRLKEATALAEKRLGALEGRP